MLISTSPILPSLTSEECLRYERHLTLREVGLEGQQRLKAARVLCVGAGGLGSPLLLYLAAAGVGTLGIVDNDVVEVSNLQRQVLYSTSDVLTPKVAAAKKRLLELNPHIEVKAYPHRLTSTNAFDLIGPYDMVVDGTDNFAARYIVNDACFHLQKTHIYASIFQFEGQCSVFTPPHSPCYRCLYALPPPPELAPNCAEAGVLGVLPGIMGSIQAMEVIKLILGIGSSLTGRLLLFDGLSMRCQELSLEKNPTCLLCAYQKPFGSLPFHTPEMCAMTTNSIPSIPSISVQEVLELKTQQKDFILLDVREPYEHAICNIGGQLIPLNELPGRLQELDTNKFIVVYCKMGGRSQQAAQLLKSAGFQSVFSLTGGVMAWAAEVDPQMPMY